MTYNRYETLKGNFPKFIKITERTTDKYVEWKNGNRMDILSYKYYNSVDYYFLILYANPKFLCEWDIPQGEIIRIPYPLDKVLKEYEDNI